MKKVKNLKGYIKSNKKANSSGDEAESSLGKENKSLVSESKKSYINPVFTTEKEQHEVKNRFWKKRTEKKPQDIRTHQNKIKILSLFRYSTKWEKALMIFGLIIAIITGILHPLMIFHFGRFTRELSLSNLVRRGYKNTTCPEGFPDITDREIVKDPDEAARRALDRFQYDHMITAVISGILSAVYFYCWYISADRQIVRMRSTFFEALITKDKSWFDMNDEHDFSAKVVDNTQRIREGIGEGLVQGLALMVTFFGSLVMSFVHGWMLSLLGFLIIPMIYISIKYAAEFESRLVVKEQAAYAPCATMTDEVFSSIRTVQAFGGHKKEFHRYILQLNKSTEGLYKNISITALLKGIPWFAFYISYAILLWCGSFLLMSKEICTDVEWFSVRDYDIGDCIIVFFCIIYAGIALVLAMPSIEKLLVARTYASEIYHITDSKSEIDSLSNDGIYPRNKCTGEITFENVFFNYPSRPYYPVLQDVSFQVTAGMKVGIVGLSASGKSTILKLILKEYLVTKGSIKVDGENISDVNTRWLRSQISFVPHLSELFDGTIEENIRTGNPDVAMADIVEACKKANAHGFIQRLEEGYSTKIGPKGSKLTGGERQRLALARAIIRNPKFLILDEPTSGLDYQSESIVQEAIKKASKNRTTFIAVHRLNTILNADLILVFHKGKIIESGTHYELIAKKEHYYNLALVKSTPSRPIVDESPGEHNYSDLQTKNIIVHKNIKHLVILTEIKNADQLLPFGQIIVNTPFDGLVRMKLITEEKEWMKRVSEEHPNGPFSTYPENTEVKGFRKLKAVLQIQKQQQEQQVVKHEHDEQVKTPLGLSNPGSSEILPTRISSSISVTDLDKSWNKYDKMREAFVKSLEPEKKSRCYFFQTLRYSLRYYHLIFLGLLTSIALALIIPMYGVILGETVHIHLRLKPNVESEKKVDDWTIVLIITAVMLWFLVTIQYGCFEIASHKTILYIRKRLYLSILHQELDFFEDSQNSPDNLTKRLSIDCARIELFIRSVFGVIIQNVLMIIFRIVIANYYFPNLLRDCMILVPFVFLFGFIDGSVEQIQEHYGAHDREDMSRLVLEVFENRFAVSGLQLERYFIIKFYEILTRNRKQDRILTILRSISHALAHSAYFWAFSTCIFHGKGDIVKNGLRKSFIVTEVLVMGMITNGFNLAIIPAFYSSITAASRIFEIINRRPKMGLHKIGKKLKRENFLGDIEFNNTFYSSSNEQKVDKLRDVSFTVKPGQLVALVGTSGSGKSSCLHLVPRFYDVDKGSLKVSTHDVRIINLSCLRSQIGLIEQNARLFNRTISENIAYGDNSRRVEKRELIEAAKNANIHTFIESLPEGYETRVGQLRGLLSSGQKLRIAIARALVRNPQILLLDEATQGLDKEAEKIVQNSLEKAREGRTCISIAHRLGSVQDADMILVFHQGQIVEKGTFGQLIEKKGLFHAFFISQNPSMDEHFMSSKHVKTSPSINLLAQIEEIEKTEAARGRIGSPTEIKPTANPSVTTAAAAQDTTSVKKEPTFFESWFWGSSKK